MKFPDHEIRLTRGEAETREFARTLAAACGPGAVWALSGDLGAGKTRFVQGLCDGLGVRAAVCSPTFAIANEYGGDGGSPRLVHLDLYRLSGPDELESIGWDDYIDSGDTLAVEWPERAGRFLPSRRTARVSIERVSDGDPETRRISFAPPTQDNTVE